MRITGGRFKGLKPDAGFAAHVRPTTDFVRESLFNKLQHTTGIEDTEVLDLFAGSGIIALEFLSRDAARVTSLDRDAKNIQHMQLLKTKMNLKNWDIKRQDVLKYLKSDDQTFDIIFADPPYDMPGITELPELITTKLKTDGIFILEHKPGIGFNMVPAETKSYGSTVCSIFAAI